MTTPIPAMQAAALEALVVRLRTPRVTHHQISDDWEPYKTVPKTHPVEPIKLEAADMLESLLRAALDAGEPQPVAVRYKNDEGRWRYLNWPFTKGWTFPPGLGKLHNLYASPVAAAPQGDAKDGPLAQEVRRRLEVLEEATSYVEDGVRSPSLAREHREAVAALRAALSSPALNEQGKRG